MNTSPKAKPDLSTESGRSRGAGKFKRFFVLILGLIITRSGGGLKPVGVEPQ